MGLGRAVGGRAVSLSWGREAGACACVTVPRASAKGGLWWS